MVAEWHTGARESCSQAGSWPAYVQSVSALSASSAPQLREYMRVTTGADPLFPSTSYLCVSAPLR
jgi:hypothetical protein